MRSAFPGLGQTPLETAKLAYNRDVGAAVLEAYSRVLESRVAVMREQVVEVLQAGQASDASSANRVRAGSPEYTQWLVELGRDAELLEAAELGEIAEEPSGSEAGSALGDEASDDPAKVMQSRRTREHAAALSRQVAEVLVASGHAADEEDDEADKGDAERWARAKGRHDAHVKEGHLANNKGSSLGASESFALAFSAYPRVATLISHVNMRLKGGEPQAAWCCAAYHAMARLSLEDKEQALVHKKLAEVSAALRPELVTAIASSVDERACHTFEEAASHAKEALRHKSELESEQVRATERGAALLALLATAAWLCLALLGAAWRCLLLAAAHCCSLLLGHREPAHQRSSSAIAIAEAPRAGDGEDPGGGEPREAGDGTDRRACGAGRRTPAGGEPCPAGGARAREGRHGGGGAAAPARGRGDGDAPEGGARGGRARGGKEGARVDGRATRSGEEGRAEARGG